mmetsp:Transcript_29999/g.97674  ORF Transcript_29999/g.97674 Transcript_29999/m.97674 type:complete len:123 (-) Transcript_29999:606-974(-)
MANAEGDPEHVKDARRQLKIKTGSLTRLKKELAAYQKEVLAERSKLEKMQADAADAADVRQQGKVLAESEMMLPDCTKRLEAALGDLQSVLMEYEGDEEYTGLEEFTAATALAEEVERSFEA